MFGSIFNSLFNKSENKTEVEKNELPSKITKQNIDDMLTKLSLLHENSSGSNDSSRLMSKHNVIKATDLLSVNNIRLEYLNDDGSINNFDDTKSECSSIGENKLDLAEVADPVMNKIIIKINNLQCPFTWKFKEKKEHNFISRIENKYGEYNLDISSPEFTFERYIGNVIIGYELFHKDNTEKAQLKVLEIGKWLEKLDKGTDEFYLSINSGLKHVMKASFIHMLFATNLIGEAKWLIDDIEPFDGMDPKSRAAVHAVHASILTEYGGDAKYLEKACECAKISCELDPNTSHWFYIYSLALTAQRQFLQSFKSSPTDNEKNAIHQAISLSNGKNVVFKYYEMILNRETMFGNFHKNKNRNDEAMIAKNLEENKEIVKTIKSIMNMEPKDPLIVVNCGNILMTLPNIVRDFNLGKQYLTKAFSMAPNDITVLNAIEKTVENYKEMINKPKTFEKEIGFIVKKYKNGEDPIPYLNDLIVKFSGFDKTKIMAQICSYTILFTNDLRTGVEQFMMLIEQPGIVNSKLITNHFSSFGSKTFNLAELVFNEIKLATNSSSVSSDDMVYYFKILNTIMETCNLKVKDVDSSMKVKLIVNSSAKSTRSSMTNHSKTDSLDYESVNENLKNNHRIINDIPKNIQNKSFNEKTSDNNELMKLKVSKFLNSSLVEEPRISNNSNLLSSEDLRKTQIQVELDNYTQQLYQKILSNTQQQNNLYNNFSDGLNRYFDQNHANMNSFIPHSQLQNPHIPPLLSLRPQINHQNPKPSKPKSKKKFTFQKK